MDVVVNSTPPEFQSNSEFTEKYRNGIKLYCDGITCHSCDDVIRHSLRDVPGIQNIDVDIPNKIVYISGANPPLGRIIEEIETFGFSITILSRGAGGSSSAIASPGSSSLPNIAPSSVTSPLSTSDANATIANAESGKPKESDVSKLVAGTVKNKKEDASVVVPLTGSTPEPNNALSCIEKGAFSVEGMTCASCVNLIETMGREIAGVVAISVNLLASKASISYDSRITTPEKICEEITDIGFKTTEIMGSKPGTITLLIDELTPENQEEVLATLQNLAGILGVTLEQCTTHEHSITCLRYDTNLFKAREVVKMVNEQTSYTAHYHQFNNSLDALNRKKEILYYRNMTIIAFIFAIPTFLIAMVLGMIMPVDMVLMTEIVQGLSYKDLTLWILATPVQFWIGKPFYVNSYHSMLELRPNMDVLIMLGTTAAYFSSAGGIVYAMIEPAFHEIPMFFETSVFLITFVFLGRYLENNAKAKTSDAIKKLFELQADEATLLVHDPQSNETREEVIDPNLIELGDILKVKPGEKIPCDGQVVFGKSTANEAMITGESMPIKKAVGDNVIAGSLNGSGILHVQVATSCLTVVGTKVGSDTALAQIIKLVEDAQCSKGETQKLADTISGYFVPVVVFLSLMTFLIWDIFGGIGFVPFSWYPPGTGPTSLALLFAITVMVIACPCALGLATPTAVMVGTGVAAELHILIKGGEVLDKAQRITTVLFDKTGTLTIGRPQVTDYHIKPGFSAQQFWLMVYAAEANSEHPLGKCIAEFARTEAERGGVDRMGVSADSPIPHVLATSSSSDSSTTTTTPTPSSLPAPPVEKFKAISGLGIKCVYAGRAFLLGNRRLMESKRLLVPPELSEQMDAFEAQGKTAVLAAFAGHVLGYIAVSDPVRPEARWVVQQLRAKKIDVAIVSGDNAKTVNHIASQLGVTRVFAEVLPKDKKDKVELMQSEGHCVAMVGDGINDSPALALADVGFAIGAGSDVAIESAGVVLMRSCLVDIMTAIDLAQTTSNRIRINFVWAFAYNLAAIPVAAGVFFPLWRLSLPPWVAGAAMAASSITVLSSSLLLKWYSPPAVPPEFGDHATKVNVEKLLDSELSDDDILLDEFEESGLISNQAPF